MEDEITSRGSSGRGKDCQRNRQEYEVSTTGTDNLKERHIILKIFGDNGQIVKFQGLRNQYGWKLLFQSYVSTPLEYKFAIRQFLIMNEAQFMAELGHPEIWSEDTWRKYFHVRSQLQTHKRGRHDSRIPYRLQRRYFIDVWGKSIWPQIDRK